MQPERKKIPVSDLTAHQIQYKLKPEDFADYTLSERDAMDRILNASYDRWGLLVRVVVTTAKLVGALVAIFLLVLFVRWAWRF